MYVFEFVWLLDGNRPVKTKTPTAIDTINTADSNRATLGFTSLQVATNAKLR